MFVILVIIIDMYQCVGVDDYILLSTHIDSYHNKPIRSSPISKHTSIYIDINRFVKRKKGGFDLINIISVAKSFNVIKKLYC